MFSDKSTLCTDIAINKDKLVSFFKIMIMENEIHRKEYEGDREQIFFSFGAEEAISDIVNYLNLNEEVYDE